MANLDLSALTTEQQIAAIYIGYYDRAGEPDGSTFWEDTLEADNGFDLAAIASDFGTQDETLEAHQFFQDPTEGTANAFITDLYLNLFNRDVDNEGLTFWSDILTGVIDGETFDSNGDGNADITEVGDIILAIIQGAQNVEGGPQDQTTILNKIGIANAWTDAAKEAGATAPWDELSDDVQESASTIIEAVDDDAATVDAAKTDIETQFPVITEGETFQLTQRADDFTGTDRDDTFNAPVTQNETGDGFLANTFDTGDVIDGGEGRNVLNADMIIPGSATGVSISAQTTNIQEVYLRNQEITADFAQNISTVDAEQMLGVEQWWTENSRSNIQIEDIRSTPSDTTFGMGQTDPGVSFAAYFNANYLEGGVELGESAFNFTIAEDGALADEIANITVNGVRFELNGETYELDGDDVEAANTWAELETALQADIDATDGLEGLTVAHQGNGQFTVTDPDGGDFVVDPAGTVISSSTTNEVKAASLGAVDLTDIPTETSVVLDDAGNGSQGGNLTLGGMSGLRGIEVFDVVVDRDSHLNLMQSTNLTPPNDSTPNEFLEEVNLTSTGANGDLQIGARTANLDGRAQLSQDNDGPLNAPDGLVTGFPGDVQSGLYNVRDVDGSAFEGDLNIAIALDNNAIGRYLDPAEEQVEFSYTGSAQDDIFNIADLSTLGSVSADEDFAMNVDMGAGDDRLVINVPNVNDTSVDGGEGDNSIVVAQSHGTNMANTFDGFANFQTYEVEGGAQHDFTSMTGIDDVVVATNGGNTQLINMEADQSATVSGKNQTVGNNSTNDQFFGTIQLTNDQGTDRTVTLDNTARLSNTTNDVRTDGVLTVANLAVNTDATLSGSASAVRNLTIDSSGERNTANAIAAVNAAAVTSLALEGTQDLSVNVNNLATAPATAQAPLDIDGSALEGDLNLALNGGLFNQITGSGTDTIVGTEGDNDTFMVHGVINGVAAANVTGFEAIQFGTVAGPLFGDLQLSGQPTSGVFDAANVTADVFNIANTSAALTLDNLGNGAVVNLGDANLNSAGNVVNGQSLTNTINLDSGATAGTPASELDVNLLSVLSTGQTHTLDIDGYQTINLDVAHAANAAATGDARAIDLTLDADARVLNLTGGDQDGDNNTGSYDTLDLTDAGTVELLTTLRTIDISGYEGEVTLDMDQAVLAATTQTDVDFVMSEKDADITIATGTTPLTDITHNSIFRFTEDKDDATDQSVWTISGDVIGAGTGGGTIDNITRFDVSDLGITAFTELDLTSFPGLIYSEAQIDASTATTDDAATWEIDLTGANIVGTLTEDNFIFA